MIQCSQNVKLQAVMMNFGDADFLSPGPFDFTDLQVSNIGAPRSVCLLLKSMHWRHRLAGMHFCIVYSPNHLDDAPFKKGLTGSAGSGIRTGSDGPLA